MCFILQEIQLEGAHMKKKSKKQEKRGEVKEGKKRKSNSKSKINNTKLLKMLKLKAIKGQFCFNDVKGETFLFLYMKQTGFDC